MTPPTRTLVIDTATAACSVALFAGDACIADHHEQVGRGHAERLIPMIAALPDGGRAEHILVDVGPGSFTGIRVGIAAARGLALGWSASIAGYSSLALIGIDAFLFRQRTDDFAVLLEGGHGEVFMQCFTGRHTDFRAMNEMVSLRPDAALARLDRRDAVGTGVSRLVDLPEEQRGAPLVPIAMQAMLLPDALRQLPASPLYGRAPDAKVPTGPHKR